MTKKILITAIAAPLLAAGFVRPAYALSLPDFGSCLNPQVAASQVNTGNNHGVVGKNSTQAGTDTIYSLSNGNVLQCLCPDNGNGVQTKWLKASNVSEADASVLKHEGWIYVITGSKWGLEDVPYLAKNDDYACKGTTQKSENKVLSLASTGSLVAIYGLVIAGVTSLLAGLLLKRFSK